jgi:transcriptional regulator with XRE-family HTH domain
VLFGSTVRDARITRNLTQAQIAALAGISRSALGNIEIGISPAELGTQVRLAAALGLPSAAEEAPLRATPQPTDGDGLTALGIWFARLSGDATAPRLCTRAATQG